MTNFNTAFENPVKICNIATTMFDKSKYCLSRGTSILGEVRNVEISRVTQQLLYSKSHDFLAVFALAHSKINQIA